jgi:hypothetical protein
LYFVEKAASAVCSLQRNISAVSPATFAATALRLSSVRDLLSSIDQPPFDLDYIGFLGKQVIKTLEPLLGAGYVGVKTAPGQPLVV